MERDTLRSGNGARATRPVARQGAGAPAARLNSLVGNRAAGQVLARQPATAAPKTPNLRKGEFLVTLKGRSSTTTEYSPDYSSSKTTVTPASQQAQFAARNFQFGVKSPRDSASGQAAGKRQYKPVTFVKEWDSASERLMQAVGTNERFDEVIFEFGGRTMTFTNVTLASLDESMDDAGGQSETVTMVFEKFHSKTGDKEYEDSWNASR